MTSCFQHSLNMSTNVLKNDIDKIDEKDSFERDYDDFQRFKELIEDEETTLGEINEFLNGITNFQKLYEYDDDMCGLIHYAAISGEAEIVTILLTKGVPIDFKSEQGKTALHFAVIEGWDDLVSLLIEKGAKLFAQDNEGNTPLHVAIISKYTDLAELLIDAATNQEELLMKDKDGYTALHIAAGLGFEQVVSKLIEKNPKIVNVQNSDGDTALHVAVIEGRVEIIKELIKKEINQDIKNNDGFTAIDLAYKEEDEDMNKDKIIQAFGQEIGVKPRIETKKNLINQ